MTTEVRLHRVLTVLLAAALLATLTVALTGGQRADAVDGPVEVVYVATGQNFPDALAGANLAATVGAPMLTVNRDLPIPDPTITALQALDPNQIIILGGPVAVSEPVADALADYARSGAVTRIEGGDRHDTAAQIADALPDKVHDTDRLDGLDSTDFLRSNASIDADAIDGFGHDELRSIPMPWPTRLFGSSEDLFGQGVTTSAAGGSGTEYATPLPADRTPAAPLAIELTLISYDVTPCTVQLSIRSYHRLGDGTVEWVTWVLDPTQTAAGGLVAMSDGLMVLQARANGLPEHILSGPADTVTVRVVREAEHAQDDCGVIGLHGMLLHY